MSSLQWTSPTRKSGTTVLSSIPGEIYQEIFSHLKPVPSNNWDKPPNTRELRSLALVCRFFCSLVVPWIFETIYFLSSNRNESSPTKFCRSILDGDEMAQTVALYVKKCVFSRRRLDEKPGSIYTEFISMYSKAMACMSNIEELILNNVTITKALVKAFTQLESLTYLELSNCDSLEISDEYLQKISLLRLKTIDIAYRPPSGGQTMRQFIDHINFDHALDVRATGQFPIQRLATESYPLQLQNLEINAFVLSDDPLIFSKILSRTPSLRTLYVAFLICDRHSTQFLPLNIDATSAPLLQTIGAPMCVLEALVPGRPVKSVALDLQGGGSNPTDWNVSHAEVLQKASCPITRMVVPFRFYSKVQFSKFFPDLHHLRLDDLYYGLRFLSPDIPPKLLNDFIDVWDKHPPLRIIHLDLSPWESLEEEIERNFLDRLFAQIPTLRQCKFGESPAWLYSDKDSSWSRKKAVSA